MWLLKIQFQYELHCNKFAIRHSQDHVTCRCRRWNFPLYWFNKIVSKSEHFCCFLQLSSVTFCKIRLHWSVNITPLSHSYLSWCLMAFHEQFPKLILRWNISIWSIYGLLYKLFSVMVVLLLVLFSNKLENKLHWNVHTTSV